MGSNSSKMENKSLMFTNFTFLFIVYKNTKKPLHLEYGVFLIYVPRKLTVPCAEFTKFDTEITVRLPTIQGRILPQYIKLISKSSKIKQKGFGLEF